MSSVRAVTSQPYVPTVHWTLGGPPKDQKVPKRGEVVAGGLLDIRLIRRGRSGRRSTLFGIDHSRGRDRPPRTSAERRACFTPKRSLAANRNAPYQGTLLPHCVGSGASRLVMRSFSSG